ncbi:MAG: hypothetical protein RMM98_17160 [Acidobacteriota bacterium]|nr:hypothetical protein [Blastocatellia bacterium]MDW8241332.1 hypothetical protein [Acidobacteriota bacterium]
MGINMEDRYSNPKGSTVGLWILIIVSLVLPFSLSTCERIEDMENVKAQLESKLEKYEESLQQANQAIEEVNAAIEEARGAAWTSFEEMGEALDKLYTVETIREP